MHYISKFNPIQKYIKEFNKINYFDENWKKQYYKHFFYINPNKNSTKYLDIIIKNYLESLMFTLKAAFEEVPSWNWSYKFRTSPLPSDVLNYLLKLKKDKKDINKEIKFKKGKPYTPFQQLLMILPPQMNNLLPKSYQYLLTDITSPIIDYYPTKFKLDVVQGEKHIYSEPILPIIHDNRVIEAC